MATLYVLSNKTESCTPGNRGMYNRDTIRYIRNILMVYFVSSSR